MEMKSTPRIYSVTMLASVKPQRRNSSTSSEVAARMPADLSRSAALQAGRAAPCRRG